MISVDCFETTNWPLSFQPLLYQLLAPFIVLRTFEPALRQSQHQFAECHRPFLQPALLLAFELGFHRRPGFKFACWHRAWTRPCCQCPLQRWQVLAPSLWVIELGPRHPVLLLKSTQRCPPGWPSISRRPSLGELLRRWLTHLAAAKETCATDHSSAQTSPKSSAWTCSRHPRCWVRCPPPRQQLPWTHQ